MSTMRTLLAVTCALGLGLAAAPVPAQDRPADCPQPSASPGTAVRPAAPERIEGEVVRTDHETNMVTIRTADGSTLEFRGHPDTVRGLRVGERVTLNRRAAAAC